MASFAPSPTSSSSMAQASSPKPGGSKQTTTTTAAAATATTSAFTPEMQDRQARGKNPYNLASDDSDEATMDDGSGRESGGNARPRRHGAPKRRERFAVHDRRRMAAQILDSPELLMMAAVRDDESISATRLKYTRMLCGVEETSPPSAAADKQRKRPSYEPGQGQRSASES